MGREFAASRGVKSVRSVRVRDDDSSLMRDRSFSYTGALIRLRVARLRLFVMRAHARGTVVVITDKCLPCDKKLVAATLPSIENSISRGRRSVRDGRRQLRERATSITP
jgi:hypothetical protein